MNFNEKKRAFTLIELMIIVFIIGLLASIILAMGVASGRNKAAINSYKTTMNSVQSALELCGEGNRVLSVVGLVAGSNVCASGYTEVLYPQIEETCGDMEYEIREPGNIWVVTTNNACKGCKIYCTAEGCQPVPGFDCN